MLPYLSLAVDGLTTPLEGRKGGLELRPEDVPSEPADTTIPDTTLGSEQLDVYGWETSLWRKIRGHIGL